VDWIGERVADQRRARQLSVSELARRVGVSPSLISQIERGQSRPSVATLFALAEALAVSVDSFFRYTSRPERLDDKEPVEEEATGARRRRGDRYFVPHGSRDVLEIEGGVRWERLTPGPLENVEFLELVYAPHAQSNEKLYRHPGSEMVLMLEGRLDIFVGFERYRLEPGDSIHFASSLPHRYVNPTDEIARAVTTILREDHESQAEPMEDET
jgi:transcriptional regulator with XRE-family HTH domain